MGFLLADVLTRCQVDSSTIFAFASTAFSTINKFEVKSNGGSQLLNSLIISNYLFDSFPRQVSRASV